ncbi:MAG TPA: fumarate reductase subunit FrdD [Chloroflexota bacterium]|nr:fumarate reductase subunit FrdD [Chloroflexota bacterium]
MAAREQVAKARPAMSHAFWWGLFAVGGMVAAVLVPVHILLQGVLGPLGVPVVSNREETFAAAVAHPLVKLYLFVLISLPFFHAAHRLRYFVFDLGVRGAPGVVASLCYGAAVVGTLVTAYILATTP